MVENDILVIGSMNMDLVVQTNCIPQKGETVFGNSFNQIPGGKGANQAFALGKLMADVGFIGACGKDDFGKLLISNLKNNHVSIGNIFETNDSTGVAFITVGKDGDNRIIVVQGANGNLSPEMINKVENQIKEAEVLLLQLEIPLETVLHTIKLAKDYDTTVILDPAPAQRLPEKIYSKIDYLLPNEGELDVLLQDYKIQNEEEKAKRLLGWGVKTIIVTKGEKGISVYKHNQKERYKTIKVNAVDTTGAGDAFAGGLGYGLQQQWEEEKSIKFAIYVAALSVTKFGAQSSLPDLEKVKDFAEERGLTI